METLRQRKKEEREKEKQAGDQSVNEVQVQLDKMKAETKVGYYYSLASSKLAR